MYAVIDAWSCGKQLFSGVVVINKQNYATKVPNEFDSKSAISDLRAINIGDEKDISLRVDIEESPQVPVNGPFYIYGEDLASGITGPFTYYRDAVAHLFFMQLRGDASVCSHDNARIITKDNPLYERGKKFGTVVTPDEDKWGVSSLPGEK